MSGLIQAQSQHSHGQADGRGAPWENQATVLPDTGSRLCWKWYLGSVPSPQHLVLWVSGSSGPLESPCVLLGTWQEQHEVAVDTVPGAQGSLARTAVILLSAVRSPGPTLGALGDESTRETSLSCPTKAGPGETRAWDTRNSGHCSVMATEQVPSVP